MRSSSPVPLTEHHAEVHILQVQHLAEEGEGEWEEGEWEEEAGPDEHVHGVNVPLDIVPRVHEGDCDLPACPVRPLVSQGMRHGAWGSRRRKREEDMRRGKGEEERRRRGGRGAP